MNAIASIGPLSINVDASTWHAYEGGVFNGCNQVNILGFLYVLLFFYWVNMEF